MGKFAGHTGVSWQLPHDQRRVGAGFSAILGGMLDHLGLPVLDMATSAAFYDAVLAPLGSHRMLDYGEAIGYGVDHPMFWLARADPPIPGPQIHIAFTAPDRATVVRFFEAAVAAGAEVLHAPRVWPEYHEAYFGAFVRDPDGNNVEAVAHRPE
jgi:catechol 2,3-dioxygenase-like lactoylglutathione lyase family enzyme